MCREPLTCRKSYLLIVHLCQRVYSTGTADEYLSVVLGVEIDETFAMKISVFEFECTCESGLFVHRKEALYSGVCESVVCDSRQAHRHTYSVVATQCGATCFKPIAIYIGLDRIYQEVVFHVTVFLADHVHMGLKDDALVLLVTRSGRHSHNHVQGLVADALYTVPGSKIH